MLDNLPRRSYAGVLVFEDNALQPHSQPDDITTRNVTSTLKACTLRASGPFVASAVCISCKSDWAAANTHRRLLVLVAAQFYRELEV